MIQICMNELYHHGILGQRWGKRNGPPYPLSGGNYTPSEREAISEERKKKKYSIYNKKHFDNVLSTDKTKLTTLNYNRDRTKNTDMFYAVYTKHDFNQYNAVFNKAIPREIYDDEGNSLGTGTYLKYRINNTLKKDMKVASEDTSADIFMKLYKKDRDFYNFVTDKNRMRDYFVKEKYRFKGYREARKVLEKMEKDPSYIPTGDDLQVVYRMFNYVIPYDGAGDSRKGKDMQTQRAKFFKEMKEAGYGAVLDTNDAIYGGFKAEAPIIVFDMENIVPDSTYLTSTKSKRFSSIAYTGHRYLGI